MLTSPFALTVTAVAGVLTHVNDERKARYREQRLDNGVPLSRAASLALCRYFAARNEFKLAGTSGSVRREKSRARSPRRLCAGSGLTVEMFSISMCVTSGTRRNWPWMRKSNSTYLWSAETKQRAFPFRTGEGPSTELLGAGPLPRHLPPRAASSLLMRWLRSAVSEAAGTEKGTSSTAYLRAHGAVSGPARGRPATAPPARPRLTWGSRCGTSL